MEWFNYTDIKKFIYDDTLIQHFCFDKKFEELLEQFIKPDFLKIDNNIRIPFFAETRDYRGAVEQENPSNKWIIKLIDKSNSLTTEMAMVVFFLDFFTQTPSAPVIITKIENTLYKASKIILRAEQLSGADYVNHLDLKEQLLLDLVNRWIYFDEDRNPNNYMVKYNSKGTSIVVAIDFDQADLLSNDIKIKGVSSEFGWEKKEKTRYLTPLKSKNFLDYDIHFFNMRFDYFNQLDKKFLVDLCEKALRFNSQKKQMSKLVAGNILKRIDYLQNYFNAHIPSKLVEKQNHQGMGKSFENIYSKTR